jgi:phage terminase large subunit-like protein
MIVHARSESTYRAISHEAYSKHGLNVSALLADEIHAWLSRDLWGVLVSSMGKSRSTDGARSALPCGCKSAARQSGPSGRAGPACRHRARRSSTRSGREFKTGGDPVLRWNVSNVRVEHDAAGNMKFAKHRSAGKIHGAVAVAMAIGRAPAREVGPSVYDGEAPSDGFLFV